VFELLVASLTCDLTPASLTRILNNPPFYSLAEFARTKTLDVGTGIADDNTAVQPPAEPSVAPDEDFGIDSGFGDLMHQINEWRTRVQLARPNAWFVFVVMNKFFSQVPYINRNTGVYSASGEVLDLAMQAFNLFWSAVGSFEKGAIFGLPQVVATVNMSGTSKNFEHHPLYMQNIAPFLQLRGDEGYYDFFTGSYTYALESHPLRRIWQTALSNIQENLPQQATPQTANASPGGYTVEVDKRIDRYVNEVRRQLQMSLTTEGIETASENDLRRLLAAVEQRCSRDPVARDRLKKLRSATNLPKNSGRRRIQRIMEKLDR
jgi:hypothetical protein